MNATPKAASETGVATNAPSHPTTLQNPHPETQTETRAEARRRRLAEAERRLLGGLGTIAQSSEAYAAFLRFRAALARHSGSYSFRNTLLLFQQRPTATLCMGFKAWQRWGRRVRKGEKGLVILAPILRTAHAEEEAEWAGVALGERYACGFRTAHVFDIAQTDARGDFEGDPIEVAPFPRLEGHQHAALYGELREACRLAGFEVAEFERGAGEGRNGYCSHRGTIGIASDLAPDHKAKTCAHELAHALAHFERDPEARGGGHPPRRSPWRIRHVERHVMELQAESAAYLTCYALGLDTSAASLPYLHSYLDPDPASGAAVGGGEPSPEAVLLGQLEEACRLAEAALALVDRVRAAGAS